MTISSKVEEKTKASIAALKAIGRPITVAPTDNAELFLREVRRGPGALCMVAPNDRWKERPFDDPEEAFRALQRFRTTHDIFVSMGTRIAGAKSRSAENTESFSGFFLDLDCHGGTDDYATVYEAVAALKAFCKTTGLPKPSYVVSSGYGLHAHWLLLTPVKRGLWKRIAEKLKALSKAHELKADHQVTADAARVLRVPNTLNFRDPEQPVAVELFPLTASSNLTSGEFEGSLDKALEKVPATKNRRRKRVLQSKAVDDTPRQRSRVSEALAHISADCAYDRYRNVVWAILSLGWHDAEDIARSWCMTAPHRFDEENFRQVVASHDEARTQTMGTLIYLAREGGWNG